MSRIIACVTVALLSLALGACGQRQDNDSPLAVDDRPGRTAPALHLILTVPEGVEAPKELLQAPMAQGAGTTLETPWVRSVKREAPSGFELLSTMGFADDASLQAWRSVHATQLVAPLTLKQARILVKSKTPTSGSPMSMFKISYYSLVAPVSEFENWVNGYLAKYLEAQLSAGILSSYVMYLEERGRALLVLEYPYAAAEQSAEPLKQTLSERLVADDAVYAKLMPLKEELRTTQSWTLAVPMTLDGE